MAHLSNPQTQRTLKFLTGVACVGVGLQSIFFSRFEEIEGFEGKEHIFTNVQRDARDFFDRNVYGIDAAAIRQQHKDKNLGQMNTKSNISGENSSSSTSVR